MKAVIVDDELASLAAFLPYIADNERINCKLFRNDPLAAVEYVKNENVSVAFWIFACPKSAVWSLREE